MNKKNEFTLMSISPIDGRYSHQIDQEIKKINSEFGLIKYRVHVEVSWFIFLLSLAPIKKKFGIYAGNRKYISFIIKFFKLRNIKIIDDDIMNLEKHKFKKISLIYIDCDIYKTTKKILSELSNKIPIGGIIVFDEGICGNKNEEPRALKEFYNSNKTKFKKIILQKNYQPDVYLKRIK